MAAGGRKGGEQKLNYKELGDAEQEVLPEDWTRQILQKKLSV